MAKKRSVILFSGGLDSTANLALCREFDIPVLALTANYGQRSAQQEIRAAQKLCQYLDIPHQTVDLTWLGNLGGSALTGNSAIPKLTLEELDQEEKTRATAKAVWVPNRNGVLINVAAAYAERLGAQHVVVGFNIEEAATFPDNSIEYLKRANEALTFSTANGVQVASYTASWDKKRIVEELKTLHPKFPFDLIWSCYHGEPTPCGTCESCQRFARATSSK